MLQNAKKLAGNKSVRQVVALLVIVATFGFFGYYLLTHKEVVDTLLHLPPYLLVLLTITYLGAIAANAYVLHASLNLLGKKASFFDNIALTSYSSIVNFFGPLQSGPGVRAVYLKAKYSVRVRDFFATTLLFYGFFALLNCAILALAALVRYPSWQAVVAVIVVGLLGSGAAFLLVKKSQKIQRAIRSFKLHNINTWLIGLGAVLLIIATACSYFLELHYINGHINFWQALVYSAAGNMALFVSLTPGAIGFREAFLVFTTKLHGIDTTQILSASIIDRAFYIGFLLVLFVVLLVITRAMKLSFQPKK